MSSLVDTDHAILTAHGSLSFTSVSSCVRVVGRFPNAAKTDIAVASRLRDRNSPHTGYIMCIKTQRDNTNEFFAPYNPGIMLVTEHDGFTAETVETPKQQILGRCSVYVLYEVF